MGFLKIKISKIQFYTILIFILYDFFRAIFLKNEQFFKIRVLGGTPPLVNNIENFSF